jgi:hypothetical protein
LLANIPAPRPRWLTETVGDRREHIPVPTHADMAAVNFDVMYEAGPFVVATGLPRHNPI